VIWALALSVAALGTLLAAQGKVWPYFALAFFLTGFGGALSNVAIRAAEVTMISPGELARVVGVARLSSYGALCLAAPLGGALVTWYGVKGGSLVLMLVMLSVGFVTFVAKPLRECLTPPVPDMPKEFLHPYRVKWGLRRSNRTMSAENDHAHPAQPVMDTAEVTGGVVDPVISEAEQVIVRAEQTIKPVGADEVTGRWPAAGHPV
jgi:MFS family permease